MKKPARKPAKKMVGGTAKSKASGSSKKPKVGTKKPGRRGSGSGSGGPYSGGDRLAHESLLDEREIERIADRDRLGTGGDAFVFDTDEEEADRHEGGFDDEI